MRSLLACLTTTALLLLSSCQQAQSTDPSTAGHAAEDRLVVLTYNIHHGEGTDGVFDLPRLADVIRNSGADLVALQEVDVNTNRASGVDQAAELARLTGMYYAFGRAIPYSDGEYGDAVLSRWPMEAVERIPLPAQPDHEKRVAVAVDVRLPNSKRLLRFVSTHFDHTSNPADRVQQAEFLCAMLFPHDIPTLVLGDLNARPESLPLKVLEKWLMPASPFGPLTMPSSTPTRKIDWVLMSRAHPWRDRKSVV